MRHGVCSTVARHAVGTCTIFSFTSNCPYWQPSGLLRCVKFCLFVFGVTAPVGQGLLIHEVSISHTTTQHSQWDSSGRLTNSSQRPLPDNTTTLTTDIQVPGGIGTHNLCRGAAADPRLKPRSHGV
jgi:hypothetical protein